MQKIAITGALVALFVAATLGPAAAQERERAREAGPRPGPGPRFADMDTNDDGEVSKGEFMEASRERAERMFERLDANEDGVITREEMQAAGQGLREERRRRVGEEGEAGVRPERRQRQRPPAEKED